jgi:hypothetical protein
MLSRCMALRFCTAWRFTRASPFSTAWEIFIFQVPPESIHLEEPIMWESLVAHVDFEGDKLKAIRFQPITMNKVGKGFPNPHDEFDVNQYHRTRGLPKPATGPQGSLSSGTLRAAFRVLRHTTRYRWRKSRAPTRHLKTRRDAQPRPGCVVGELRYVCAFLIDPIEAPCRCLLQWTPEAPSPANAWPSRGCSPASSPSAACLRSHSMCTRA